MVAPACEVSKPLVLLRAMKETAEGEYVMWADASKYDTKGFKPEVDMKKVVGMIKVRGSVWDILQLALC